MIMEHTLPLLLWRLQRETGLYLFGAGASAPYVPMAPDLQMATAANYNKRGLFPTESSSQTVLTKRIQEQARGRLDFWGRDPRADFDEIIEVLGRLGHDGALAQYMHQLAQQRFVGCRIPNYSVLRHSRRSSLITWNMDGLARDTCSNWHRVVESHGNISAKFGSNDGAKWANYVQEWELEFSYHSIHAIGPERFEDVQLLRKLRALQDSRAAFVMIVGYSFGLFNGQFDDQVSYAAFIGRYRDVPIDIYVCSPHPQELAGVLSEELRSNRVHTFSSYWNVLAWAFEQVISGKIESAQLDYVHEMTLDTFGPSFISNRFE